MIEVQNLSFRYRRDTPFILNKLSFSMGKGSILVILGRNGIGKTTFIRCLTGGLKGYNGSISVQGQEVKNMTVEQLSSTIAFVASNNPCYQNLRVADFLTTGLTNKLTSFQAPNKRQYELAFSVLEQLGHGNLYNKNIFEISSGELQIIKIGRAILQDPQIIVFDEPTSNLDIKNQLVVLNQITYLAKLGYCVVTTTHNPGQALELNDMVLMMKKGGHLFGTASSMITEENLKDVYSLDAQMEQGHYRKYISFSDKERLHNLIF